MAERGTSTNTSDRGLDGTSGQLGFARPMGNELRLGPFLPREVGQRAPGQYRILLVDDEPAVCRAISQTLMSLSYGVTCFTHAHECLRAVAREECDLLISDINMPEMNGIELLKAVKQIRPLIPVLLITGFGDIPIAVQAVKAGAFDFIEKPLDENTFLPLVRQALKQVTRLDSLSCQPLTETERRVLHLIVDGKANKEIACVLDCSVRTVENHRYRLMHKLNVDGTAALVKLALTNGLV